MVDRRALGALGEDAVAAWYEARSYKIVDRNWRCREGELDLVARRGPTLVFCEVKTRTTDRFGVPAESITPLKAARIRRLAARWLAGASRPAAEVRFDVASVLAGQVDVVEGAF